MTTATADFADDRVIRFDPEPDTGITPTVFVRYDPSRPKQEQIPDGLRPGTKVYFAPEKLGLWDAVVGPVDEDAMKNLETWFLLCPPMTIKGEAPTLRLVE